MTQDVDVFQSVPETLGEGRFAVGPVVRVSGMARVHRGTEVASGRDVALKMMEGGFVQPELRQRFLAEIKVLAEIDHPRVVKVIAAGRDGAWTWFAMEWLAGGSLREELVENGPADPHDAGRWIIQALDGLAVCHSRGLIHRDVKPSNLIRDGDGLVKLADFGVARHPEGTVKFKTETGSRMGSQHYSAPEVRMDATNAAEASDIYSMGASLFELLTGVTPLRLYYTEDPDAALDPVPRPFRSVVATACAHDKTFRYGNALMMRDALVVATNTWCRQNGLPEDAGSFGFVDPEDTGIFSWIKSKLAKPK